MTTSAATVSRTRVSSLPAHASSSSRSKRANWVAEDPELHLKPHVDAWLHADGRLGLTRAYSDDRGAFILDLSWLGGPAGPGEVRAAVYALIGQFAESATYVRQRRDENDRPVPKLRFEVGTGELDGAFASHGHTVLINVT